MAEAEESVGIQIATQARKLVFSSDHGPQERQLANLVTNRQQKKEGLGESLIKYY